MLREVPVASKTELPSRFLTMTAVGIRVIRGLDWNLNNDDGGEGHVGTVVEVRDHENVNVTWDGGQVTVCRGGQGKAHDLRVVDNATVGIRHPSITCDACGQTDIIGMRWKCAECDHFNLCSPCYFSDCHDCSHQFYRYETSSSTQEKVECRNKSMKMRVLGIFPDATVVRGLDWEWKDQDGGQGSEGRVLEVMSPSVESAHSMVNVQWSSGQKNVYRLGFKGKVDLQYTEEAPGAEFYPQHLPAFESQNYKEQDIGEKTRVSDAIAVGDNVMIAVTAAELQKLQKERSGWAIGMAECMGKVGKVQGVAPNGDLNVVYGQKRYRLFPGSLRKATAVTVGSRVRILNDEAKVKMQQEGHGGYNEKMRLALGKVGEVIKVDTDGDLVVKFADCHWVFSPACCTAAPGAEIDRVASQGDGNSLSLKMGDFGGDLLQQLSLLAKLAEKASGLSSKLSGTEGDFMKVIADKHEDRALEMLKSQPSLAKCGSESFTALHIAANRGLLRLATALVEGGADVSKKDSDGDTPLMAALSGGEQKMSEYLMITKGCSVQVSNDNGQTAAHKSASSGFDGILQLLITHGADLNAQDNHGDTPLHDAISSNRLKAAEVLLSWPQIDLHRKNKIGFPLLHFACLSDASLIAERIVSKDRSTLNVKKDDGVSPLHVCAFNGHHVTMKMLIEKGGAVIDSENLDKQTPLWTAAHLAHVECVQLLVKHGANVNVADNKGNTPLHAVFLGLHNTADVDLFMTLLDPLGSMRKTPEIGTKIACFLVENGSHHEAKNNDGLAPLDLRGDETVKEAVKKYIQNGKSGSTILGADEPGLSTSASSVPVGSENLCRKCCLREAVVLLVPCGHRALCRQCVKGLSVCPQCKDAVKAMFDKDGRKLSSESCAIM